VPRPDAGTGEDVSRTPTTIEQWEYVAMHGALEPGERFPEHLAVDHGRRPAYSRAEMLALRMPERWHRALLDQEQREADQSRQEPS
jgi:hypothetical protein